MTIYFSLRELIFAFTLAVVRFYSNPATGQQKPALSDARPLCYDLLMSPAEAPFELIDGLVPLTRDQSKVFHRNSRGALQVLMEGRFSGSERATLWRAAVRELQYEGIFISDEIVLSYNGQTVWSFVGADRSTDRRSLLLIMEDGAVYLTYSSSRLVDLLNQYGGGHRGQFDGTTLNFKAYPDKNITAEMARAHHREVESILFARLESAISENILSH